MAKGEYEQGPKARKKFERAMTALFKVSKTELADKIKKRSTKSKD